MKKILVTGSNGQIGSELVAALREKYGKENVVGLSRNAPPEGSRDGPYETLDATDKEGASAVISKHGIDTVFHLVGVLSAAGEKNPEAAWRVNMKSLKIMLDLSRESGLKMFWPSSIAAFGPTTPRKLTPQHTVLEPATMYGVTKVAGELLCQYNSMKYGVDVRSLRYPGIISYKTPPGGGTTDYAVAIFYDAIAKGEYTCFVGPHTVLPMMYMPDAIRGTIELMEAPAEKIRVRTSYNMAAISFSAQELADVVSRKIPGFKMSYAPDSRQKIADSWPQSIDDSDARAQWGWKHSFDLDKMADDMIANLKIKLGKV